MEGKDLPLESSSGSKALARLSLSPSMNSNPSEETNSSTSCSSSEGVVVTAELPSFVENWIASLISGSIELIAPMNLSTYSLYGYDIGNRENAAYNGRWVSIWMGMRITNAPDRDSTQTIQRGHRRIRSA